jgi:hypothetical protein
VSEKWARAVLEAGEDAPADLAEAARDELVSLWTDLDHAVHYAYRGGWSMGCEWITRRIVRLSRLAGATPWGQIPIPLLLDGTYQGILTAAGIAFEEPGADDMRGMKEWADREAEAVRQIGR